MAQKGFIDPPMDINVALRKVSEGTATIREFLQIGFNSLTEEQKEKYPLRSPKKRGLLDIFEAITKKNGTPVYDIHETKWMDVLDENNVARLQIHPATDEGFFKKLLTIENRTKDKYRSLKKLLQLGPYLFSHDDGMRIGGNATKEGFGIASSISDELLIELGGEKESNSAFQKGKDAQGNTVYKRIGDQARNVKDLPYLPSARKLGPIIQTWLTKGIDSLDIKLASLFNILVPFRIGEVATLTYADVDFETGITKEWVRGNKTRSSVQLSRFALEILRKLREVKIKSLQALNPGDNTMPELGAIGIFSDEAIEKTPEGKLTPTAKAISKKFTDRVTTSISTGPNALFNLLRKAYRGKYGPDDLSGGKDLRKFSLSFFKYALQKAGKSTAIISKISGHLSKDRDVGKILEDVVSQTEKAYITELDLDVGEIRQDRAALDIYEGAFGRSVGADNVNQLPTQLGVDTGPFAIDALDTKKGAQRISFPKESGERVPSKPPTRAEIAADDAKAKKNTAQDLLDTAKIKGETADVESATAGKELETSRVIKASAGETEQNRLDTNEIKKQVRAESQAKIDADKPKTIPEQFKKAGVIIPELDIPDDATRAERKVLTDEWNKKLRKIMSPANLSKIRSFLTFAGVGGVAGGLLGKAAPAVAKLAGGLTGEAALTYLDMTGETGPRPIEEMSEEELLSKLQNVSEGTYKQGVQGPTAEQIDKEADRRATEQELEADLDYKKNLFPGGLTTMPVPQRSRAPKAKSAFVEKYEDVLSSTFHAESFEDPDNITQEYEGFIPTR